MKLRHLDATDAIRAALAVGIIVTAMAVVAQRSITMALVLIGVAVVALATGRSHPVR